MDVVLNPERSINRQEKVRVVKQGDQLAIYNNYKGRIRQTIIRPDGITELKPQLDITPLVADNRIQEALTDDVRFWYDRFFLAWGYQKTEGRKTVYYLNKIEF